MVRGISGHGPWLHAESQDFTKKLRWYHGRAWRFSECPGPGTSYKYSLYAILALWIPWFMVIWWLYPIHLWSLLLMVTSCYIPMKSLFKSHERAGRCRTLAKKPVQLYAWPPQRRPAERGEETETFYRNRWNIYIASELCVFSTSQTISWENIC